jgi:hypothetical protein
MAIDSTDKARRLPIVLKSPIEFAITGPFRGRDRVLVRSENATLDLIGLASQVTGSHARPASDPLTLFFDDNGQLNVISSFPLPDIDLRSDSRSSKLSFAWRGYVSRARVGMLEKVFNLCVSDITFAISTDDDAEVEWTVGPLIYQCVRERERRFRLRRVFLATAILYAGLGLSSVLLLVWRLLGEGKMMP